MPLSDDQRREVARRLRSVTREELRYVFLEEILNCAVGGRCLDDEGDIDERLVLRRLADLIDRPTCQMKSIPTSSHRVCSRCGAFVRKDAVTNCTEAIPVRFCPNCDAMVVEKEENDGKR